MNRYGFLGMAFLTAILTTASHVSLAQSGLKSKTLPVSREYNNDLCIVLGRIKTRGEVSVVWGKYRGQTTIDGDGGERRHAIALFARGDNEANMTIYYNTPEEPDLRHLPCDRAGSDIVSHSLSWSER